MRVLRPALTLAALLVALAVPSAASAAGPPGLVFDHGPGGERYVALGDSAAAGPGVLPTRAGTPAVCTRSEHDFAGLAAASLDVAAFGDITCSSATTDDLTAAQADNPPQLDALSADTTVVTLGPIGANDAGIVPAVLGCLVPGCAERDGSQYTDAITALRPKVDAALDAVHARSPSARIVVVGYGRYLPPGGCPGVQPITASDADYAQGLVDTMDGVLRDAAEADGDRFADLRATPGALDHTACAVGADRWLQGLVPVGDGVPFHPSTAGMTAFAGTVARAIGDSRPAAPTAPATTPTTAATPPAAPLATSPSAGAVAPSTAPAPVATAHPTPTALSRRCVAGGLRLRVVPGSGPAVREVDFRLGSRVVLHDRTAPFEVTVPHRRLVRLRGAPRAVVVATGAPGAPGRTTLARTRPRC